MSMSVTTKFAEDGLQRMSLREQVERLLPAWESWYPSLFHAAEDLGLIRARVCSPSSLMLSNRHASIQSEALQAFKEQWCVEDEQDQPLPVPGKLSARSFVPQRVTKRRNTDPYDRSHRKPTHQPQNAPNRRQPR